MVRWSKFMKQRIRSIKGFFTDCAAAVRVSEMTKNWTVNIEISNAHTGGGVRSNI